jgi:hypothetical protein
MTVLGTGYWNIHGHMSKVVGDKLCDPEFLDTLKGTDVLGMGELHAEGEVSIPGFVSVKQKIRKKKFSGPKIAGGIAVFVREEVKDLVQVLENSNEDSIWIKIKKDKFGGKNDIYIGTYYVSPEGNSERSKKNYDFLSTLNDEIAFYSKKGPILLQGDFNSRTGVGKDFVEFDKSDLELGIENFDNQNGRNSEDKKVNSRGKELLDVCKLNDLLILNGRKTGDIFGAFTSHNWNGSSVVDYSIASNSITDCICNFSVGQYIPWLSDHCLINAKLDFGDVSMSEIEQMIPTDLHPGWVWNEPERETFTENLSLPYFKEKFEALENSSNLNPSDLAKEIKLLLVENTKISQIKLKKKDSGTKSDPWFDSECKSKKEHINCLGNKIKKIANRPVS